MNKISQLEQAVQNNQSTELVRAELEFWLELNKERASVEKNGQAKQFYNKLVTDLSMTLEQCKQQLGGLING